MYKSRLISPILSALATVTLLLAALPADTLSRENDNLTNTYFHFGAGYSTFGPSIQIGVVYRPNQYALNVRYLSSFNSGNGFVGSTNSHLDVIFGRAFGVDKFTIIGGLGLSAVLISARPDAYSGGILLQADEAGPEASSAWLAFRPDENDTRLTAGIPVDVQIGWNITPKTTLAFHTFANLNTLSTNVGVLATLQLRLPRQGRQD